MLVEFLSHTTESRVSHSVLATSSIAAVADGIRDLGVPCFQPRRRARYDPGTIVEMAHWMRARKIDIVHTYNVNANCWGGIAARLAGVRKHIGGEHGTAWTTRPPLSWLERIIYGNADLIVANSEASKQMLIRRRGLKGDRIRVVYNGVAPPHRAVPVHRHELGITRRESVMGTIGRLDTPKGLFSWLEGAKQVTHLRDDVRFVVVGGGPLKESLEDYAVSLGIGDRMIFTGWRPDAKELLTLFDLFVSTSIREPFGNVLVEAALCRKAVVAPSVDGIPEAVQDRVTGILLEPTESVRVPTIPGASPMPRQVIINGVPSTPKVVSAERVAETVDRLLDHPELRSALGGAGLRRAAELFSIRRYVSDLEQIYLAMAG
jgi:glycosyltransferase involved in cell wall biosynthesis